MDHYDELIRNWLAHAGVVWGAMFKLTLAAVLGGLVGLEREIRGREAGFRTNLLVCLGSALVMVVSARMASHDWFPAGAYAVNVDPGRIAYGVMTGVGFLGAGAILKHGASVRGLTTAAGLWCVAAIGLAVGLGLYVVSMLTTLLVLIALWALDRAEHLLPRRRFRLLRVRTAWGPGCVGALVQRVAAHGVNVHAEGFSRAGDLSQVDVRLTISFMDRGHYDAAETELLADPQYQVISSQRA
jgi:putative Mg2+ transporter-C (MgtC) family protein